MAAPREAGGAGLAAPLPRQSPALPCAPAAAIAMLQAGACSCMRITRHRLAGQHAPNFRPGPGSGSYTRAVGSGDPSSRLPKSGASETRVTVERGHTRTLASRSPPTAPPLPRPPLSPFFQHGAPRRRALFSHAPPALMVKRQHPDHQLWYTTPARLPVRTGDSKMLDECTYVTRDRQWALLHAACELPQSMCV